MNKTEKEKYILYGASFDPPHMGHFCAIQQMLEKYDKVIVFPYPRKIADGKLEKISPLKERMKMMEIFLSDFFPQIPDRLMLSNLSSKLKHKDQINDGFFHTYDYLKYVQVARPEADLSVCFGFEAQNLMKESNFYKEDDIKKEFGTFFLQEESNFSSKNIRKYFENTQKIKSNKEQEFLIYCLGHSLVRYILKNNLYGLTVKKNKKEKLEQGKNKIYSISHSKI